MLPLPPPCFERAVGSVDDDGVMSAAKRRLLDCYTRPLLLRLLLPLGSLTRRGCLPIDSFRYICFSFNPNTFLYLCILFFFSNIYFVFFCYILLKIYFFKIVYNRIFTFYFYLFKIYFK